MKHALGYTAKIDGPRRRWRKSSLPACLIQLIPFAIFTIPSPSFAVDGASDLWDMAMIYRTSHDALISNRGFHKANNDILESILRGTTTLSFDHPSIGPPFVEHFDASGNWSFTQPGAVLVQQFGKWSISADSLCIAYKPASAPISKKCRTIWLSPNGKEAIIEGSANSSRPNWFYRVLVNDHATPFSNDLLIMLREH